MSKNTKIEIEIAEPELHRRWLDFHNEFYGKRFCKDRIEYSHWEIFAAIEQGMINYNDLRIGKTFYKIVKSDYSQKKAR